MKASGSYGNLIQGVSQQSPKDRREGQLGEMVNMIPDPVNGLSRRHGSKWVSERDTGITSAGYAAAVVDSASWRKFEYNNAGHDYVLCYRARGRAVGSTLPSMVVFDRTSESFLPVVRHATDPDLDNFEYGGCSAITSIGKYVFAAGHNVIPAASSTSPWAAEANQDKAVVWIRGGGYSRTFKVSAVKVNGTVINFSYTTPKSSFSGTLDTSKVPPIVADPAGGTDVKTEGAFVQLVGAVYQHTLTWAKWSPTTLTAKKGTVAMSNVHPAAPSSSTQFAWVAGAETMTLHSSNLGATDITVSYTALKTITNPNYSQIVNALVNEYNSAVTLHIGAAAEAIQPQAIAEQLRLAAVAAGFPVATIQDSTLILEGVKALTVQDGGDGTLIRGVANEVASADQVSNLHLVGKVVKVTARGSEESYYLKAVSKNTSVTSGYTEVSWEEAAGVVYSFDRVFMFGTVSDGSFYIASSPAILTSILPGVHPTWATSTVGDSNTSPLPFFIGRKITYLGVFQDRLAIGCGGVLRFSRIGDYLNMFRTSVLTAPANDALETLSQGSEDDVLMHSVLYDRDLVIFGEKRQYAISGRAALSPSNANMSVMSSHEGAAAVPPVAVGGVIFYGKQGLKSPSVHELRPGQVAESPEAYPVSSQLNTYFPGEGIELAAMAKPAMLFFRTTGARSSIYPFSYLDTGNGRQQDAWGRWDFNSALGVVLGMTGTKDGLLTIMLREAHNKVWVVADVCPVSAELSDYPYLDSNRDWATVASNVGSLRPSTTGAWYVSFDSSTDYKFLGASLEGQPGLVAEFPTASGLWAGALQDSQFIPTNPFIRDRKDKPVLTGRLTVTKLVVSYNQTAGFDSDLLSNNGGAATTITFNGYVLGGINSNLGRVPISQGQFTLSVGKETSEYTSVIKARTWLPMNITGIDWVGQFFNNTQRLG